MRHSENAVLEGAHTLRAQRVYHEPIRVLAMITSAFLLKVIIYGLIAAVIIPAIDFVLFVIRESRRPTYSLSESASDAADWRAKPPAPQIVRRAPTARAMQRQRTEARGVAELRHRSESSPHGDGARVAARHPTGEVVPPPRVYVASNGVTITPGMGAIHTGTVNASRTGTSPVQPSGHPHAEYWNYGSPRFYES